MLSKFVASRRKSESHGFDQYVRESMARERVRKRLALLGKSQGFYGAYDGHNEGMPVTPYHGHVMLSPLTQAVPVPRLWEEVDISAGGDSVSSHSLSMSDISVRSRSPHAEVYPIIHVPSLTLPDDGDVSNTNNSQDWGDGGSSADSHSSLTHVSTMNDTGLSENESDASSSHSKYTVPSIPGSLPISPHSNTIGEVCCDVLDTDDVSMPDLSSTDSSSVASISVISESTRDMNIIDVVISGTSSKSNIVSENDDVDCSHSQLPTMPKASHLLTLPSKQGSGSFATSVVTSVWSAAPLIPQNPEPSSCGLPAMTNFPDEDSSNKVAYWLTECQDHLVMSADDQGASSYTAQTAAPPVDASKSTSTSVTATNTSSSISNISDNGIIKSDKADLVLSADDLGESSHMPETAATPVVLEASKSTFTSLTDRSTSSSVSDVSDYSSMESYHKAVDHRFQNSLANVRRIQKLWRPKPTLPCNPMAPHQKLY